MLQENLQVQLQAARDRPKSWEKTWNLDKVLFKEYKGDKGMSSLCWGIRKRAIRKTYLHEQERR